MAAKHIYTYINPTRPRDLQAACDVLNNDGIIAYPTDVNWAIGFNPRSAAALQRIQQIKPLHPKEQPFSLLCSDLSMAATIGEIDTTAYKYLRRALPGPYTIILRCNRTVSRHIRDARRVVGIRIPQSPLLLDLVKLFGEPIATTSFPKKRDLSDSDIELPYKYGYEINEDWGNHLDMILDLSEELPGDETTIISMVEGAPELIRLGAGDISLFGIPA